MEKSMNACLLAVVVLGGLIAGGAVSFAAQTCRQDLAASTPDSRFTVNGDGTVTDKVTGLIWKRCSEGRSGTSCENGTAATFDWDDARTGVTSISFAGKRDWRLPTIQELDSIVEYQCTMPAINTAVFPATPASNFWSASPYAGYATGAWNLNFNDGVHDNASKNYRLYVRLVRGAK